MPRIVGSRIVEVRDMTAGELRAMGWTRPRFGCPQALVLDSGAVVFASGDDEGNGPGALLARCNRKLYDVRKPR